MTEFLQFFHVLLLLLDALLTGAGESFCKLASTPRAGRTKHLLRVCHWSFRNNDCEGFPSRPRSHRVPADGVSKGRLDPPRGDSGAGRWTKAIRLPRERSRAWLQRSAQLVGFARRPGNQQFASKHASSGCPRPVTVPSCNQSGRGREAVA